MKKLLLLSFLSLCFLLSKTRAQTPFNTMDSIDINNIAATILVHGDMWWNPVTELAACSYPKGSPKNINFAASIWMSAHDGAGQLHVAAQTYRQDGNDYWPGPLDANDTLTYTTSQNWAKIWKVNGSDVQYFNSLTTHTTANTPPAILTWPAKGNANAQGNGGAPLTITSDMAPFVDLNGNGIYEPLIGEYPDFKGDQALWWVFSDNGPTHTSPASKPLGVEIHALAYAYNRGTLIDNVIYYDYTFVNRSTNNYNDFRFAQWDDVDLGWYYDDFLGVDSARRLAICYNGTNDDGGGGGHPLNSYGPNPPQTGITMISLPGDVGTTYIPAGAFVYYNNEFSSIGSPSSDTACYNLMHAIYPPDYWVIDSFQGPGGTTDSFYVTHPNTNYVFTQDPANPSITTNPFLTSECALNNNPGDRRFVFSSNSFTLNAGTSQHVVLAQVVTDTTGAGGCPHASFAGISRVSDTAWNAYYNPPTPLHRAVPTGTATIAAYPNPSQDILYVEDKLHNLDGATIVVYNYTGNVVYVPITKDGQRFGLDIRYLPVGIYNVLYQNGAVQTTTKFLKQ